MTEQRSGLRFDIYERVHLAEGAASIQELDEMELIPHIQVASFDEQAVLKGNLWLGGRYVGEGNESGRTLEHFIPVEITLPLSRVHRLDEVTVEIENFDVELLSARTLNVTGVLTLHGVDMLSAKDEQWNEPVPAQSISNDSEAVSFVADSEIAETERSENKTNVNETESLSEITENFHADSILETEAIEPALLIPVNDESTALGKKDIKIAISGTENKPTGSSNSSNTSNSSNSSNPFQSLLGSAEKLKENKETEKAAALSAIPAGGQKESLNGSGCSLTTGAGRARFVKLKCALSKRMTR